MRRRIRTLFLTLICAVGLAVTLMALRASRPVPSLALPNPNGYDTFVKASGAVVIDPGSYETLEQEELRELVSKNAEALRWLRQGLTQRSVVPVDLINTNYFQTMMSDLTKFKSLSFLLAAEGRLAEMENRSADAARCYTDTIRFGDEISRGGFLINRLVGVGCETRGYNLLVALGPKLNCEEVRPTIAQLEKVDINGVTWDEVRQMEQAFIRQGLRKTMNPIQWIAAWWQLRPAIKRSEDKNNQILARLRLLTVELALCCYQSEQRRAPERLEQLVPKYLQRVPSDPFSGQLLMYHTQGTNWVLYSVGPDGVDDNGKGVGRSVSSQPNPGDLFFDSPW